jgi:glucose-fructose oxidoreductase
MARTVSTKESVVRRSDLRLQKTLVRYAVVGLGHIAQVAVLPAFGHAKLNSQLTALVSDDPQKLKQLSRRYEVPYCYSFREYDQCLREGYIGAAKTGIHLLCEKPMAVTEQDARA